MLSLLNFTDKRSKVGTMVLDALMSEELTFEAEVTRYPVEDGTIISDHITRGAETLSISGVCAVSEVTSFLTVDLGKPKMVTVVELLRKMHKDRTLVDVNTGNVVHRGFGIERMTCTKTSGDAGGNLLAISFDLVKVNKVRLKTASVPAARAAAPAAGRAGATNTAAGRTTSATSQAATSTAATGAPAARLNGGTGSLGQDLRDSSLGQGVGDLGRRGVDSLKTFLGRFTGAGA